MNSYVTDVFKAVSINQEAVLKLQKDMKELQIRHSVLTAHNTKIATAYKELSSKLSYANQCIDDHATHINRINKFLEEEIEIEQESHSSDHLPKLDELEEAVETYKQSWFKKPKGKVD